MPTAWVAPTAAVIGDVTIGAGSNVWYHCVLRGDTNFIRIGAGTNIQDGTIIHVNPGRRGDHHRRPCHGRPCRHHPCLHAGGPRLRRHGRHGAGRCGASRKAALLAAGSVLPPRKRMGKFEFWVGNPAKFVRVLGEEERARFDRTAPHYVELAGRHKATLAG